MQLYTGLPFSFEFHCSVGSSVSRSIIWCMIDIYFGAYTITRVSIEVFVVISLPIDVWDATCMDVVKLGLEMQSVLDYERFDIEKSEISFEKVFREK